MSSERIPPRYDAWASDTDSDDEDARPNPSPAVLSETAAKTVRQLTNRTPLYNEWVRGTYRNHMDGKYNGV